MTLKKVAGIFLSAAIPVLFIGTPILLAEGLVPYWFGLTISLIPTLVLLLIVLQKSKNRFFQVAVFVAITPLIYLLYKAGLIRAEYVYLINFVTIYGIFAWLFGRTLTAGETPLCTKFAAIVHETLSPQVIVYTRRLTLIWTLLFAVQIPIWSILFLALPVKDWSELLSLVPPVLIVGLFGLDLLVRQFCLPHEDRKDALRRTLNSISRHRQQQTVKRV